MQTDRRITGQKLLNTIKKHWIWMAAVLLLLSFLFVRDLFYLILILAVSVIVLVTAGAFIIKISIGLARTVVTLVSILIAVGTIIALLSLL